jgi:hypothetical protein
MTKMEIHFDGFIYFLIYYWHVGNKCLWVGANANEYAASRTSTLAVQSCAANEWYIHIFHSSSARWGGSTDSPTQFRFLIISIKQILGHVSTNIYTYDLACVCV